MFLQLGSRYKKVLFQVDNARVGDRQRLNRYGTWFPLLSFLFFLIFFYRGYSVVRVLYIFFLSFSFRKRIYNVLTFIIDARVSLLITLMYFKL